MARRRRERRGGTIGPRAEQRGGIPGALAELRARRRIARAAGRRLKRRAGLRP